MEQAPLARESPPAIAAATAAHHPAITQQTRVNVPALPLGPGVPRSIPFGMGPRIEFHATFDHRPMHMPAGPLTFVDTISRFAPVSLPNGQQAFVLQVQDGALSSPFTMGMPFGEALALNPADWVVGDDLDAVVSRVLDAYMPPRRSTPQEVCNALPRLRVRPGPLSPRPTATRDVAAAAAASGFQAFGGGRAAGEAHKPPGLGSGCCSGGSGAGRVGVRLGAGEDGGVRLQLAWPAEEGPASELEGRQDAGVMAADTAKAPVAAPGDGAASVPGAEGGGTVAAGASAGAGEGYASCQPGELCTVCHDPFEPGGDVVELPCRHCFHEGCIMPWLQQQNTCPVCRKRLREGHESGHSAAPAAAGGPSGDTEQRQPPHPAHGPSDSSSQAQGRQASAPTAAAAAEPAASRDGAAPGVAARSDVSVSAAGPAGGMPTGSPSSDASAAAAAGSRPDASPAPASGPAPAPPATQQPSRRPPTAAALGPQGSVQLPVLFAPAPVSILRPEDLRAAEAALTSLRTRFPPLSLGGPRAPVAPAGLGDLLASFAGPAGQTRGSPAPASGTRARAASGPGAGRSSGATQEGLGSRPRGGAGQGPQGGAGGNGQSVPPLRSGFFNQHVNLYGRGVGVSARGTAGGGAGGAAMAGALPASSGSRSALRGGFFNTANGSGGAAAGAAGAQRARGAGMGEGSSAASSNDKGGATAPSLPGAAQVPAPTPCTAKASAPPSGAAISGLGSRLPQRPAARSIAQPVVPDSTAATATPGTPAIAPSTAGSVSTPSRTAQQQEPPVPAAAALAASAAAGQISADVSAPAVSQSKARERSVRARPAESEALGGVTGPRAGRSSGGDEEGDGGKVVAGAAGPTRRVARHTLHQDAATLAHLQQGAAGAPAEREGQDCQAAGPSGLAARGGQAHEAEAAVRGRRVARVKVVRRGGHPPVGSPRGVSPAAGAGVGNRRSAALPPRRAHSGGGSAGGAAAGAVSVGRSSGGGGFNPVSMVVGGAGAGLRFLGGMAAGLFRRGGGSSSGGNRHPTARGAGHE